MALLIPGGGYFLKPDGGRLLFPGEVPTNVIPKIKQGGNLKLRKKQKEYVRESSRNVLNSVLNPEKLITYDETEDLVLLLAVLK
jgi:hypothetical protein